MSGILLLYYGVTGFLMVQVIHEPFRYGAQHYEFLHQVRGVPLFSALRSGTHAIQVVMLLLVLIGAPRNSPLLGRLRPYKSPSVDAHKVLTAAPVAGAIVVAHAVSQGAPWLLPAGIANVAFVLGLFIDYLTVFHLARWLRARGTPAKAAAHLHPLLFLIAVRIGTALYSGYKGRVVEAMVVLIAAFVLLRGRFPIKIAFAVGLVLFALFLPWSLAYRSNLAETESRDVSGRAQAAERAVRSAFTDRYDVRLRRSAGYLALRLGTQRIDDLGTVLALDARAETSTLTPFLTSLIPRAVWPSKPSLSASLNQQAKMLGKSSGSGDNTNVTWTMFTDLALNFGRSGIVLGSVIVGLVLRFVAYRLTVSIDPISAGISVLVLSVLWREGTVGYSALYLLQVATIWIGAHHVAKLARPRPLAMGVRT